jgi:hypothetical protein
MTNLIEVGQKKGMFVLRQGLGAAALLASSQFPIHAKDNSSFLVTDKPPTPEVFVIQNLAADGDVPVGTGQTTEAQAPSNDLPRILEKVKANQNLSYIFNRGLTQQNLIDDLTIYYPIFKAVGDVYGLDWELLITIAEEETTASRNLGDGSTYAGIEQRQISKYSDEYAEEALTMKGLESLKNIKGVRHPEDAREIAAMARIIIDKMKETDGTILGALRSYGPDGQLRLDIVYQLKEALK